MHKGFALGNFPQGKSDAPETVVVHVVIVTKRPLPIPLSVCGPTTIST